MQHQPRSSGDGRPPPVRENPQKPYKAILAISVAILPDPYTTSHSRLDPDQGIYGIRFTVSCLGKHTVLCSIERDLMKVN